MQDKGKKQGVYQKPLLKEKAEIGKYVSEHGVASAVRRYIGMRSRGTPIGTSVVIRIATGILLKHKKATVSSFRLTKEWAKSVLRPGVH